MKRVHIVGRKNSGKTTLIVQLVHWLTGEGLRVGTVKHTHHQHELDTPGKDSHRHRTAGAEVVGILSPDLNAVFFRPAEQHDEPDRYSTMAPLFQDCDVVLVEGHSQTDAPKLEVWRADTHAAPMAVDDPSILAVITDDALDINTPLLPRRDVATIAAHVCKWLGVS